MAFPSMLVLALLFVATTPLAHGLTINGTGIADEVKINGQVFCTVTGNSEPGSNSAGAAGANVSLSCGGNQTILARATTNASGTFNITVSTPAIISNIVNDLANCTVAVELPIANCSVTPKTGRLVATILPLDRTVDAMLGTVLTYVIKAFSLVL